MAPALGLQYSAMWGSTLAARLEGDSPGHTFASLTFDSSITQIQQNFEQL